MAGWGIDSAGLSDPPPGATKVVAVVAGDHSLALEHDGTVVAWGRNDAGQTDVPMNLTNVVAIAAVGSRPLALKADRTVVAGGNDNSGQATVPPGLQNVIAIAGGLAHSLALVGEPVSAPQLVNPLLLNTTFSVQVHCVPGKTYVLECKDSLDDPAWTELDTIAGRGVLQSLTDTDAPLFQRFYRVRRQ